MAKVLIIAGLAESLLNFRGPLIRAILSAGHQVYACAPECDDECKKRLFAAGVKFSPIPMSRTGLNPLEDMYTVLAIHKLCKKHGPDMVLAYTIKPIVYGLLAARMAGVSQRFALITGLGYAFTDENSGVVRKFINRLAKGLYKIGLQGCEGVFFQNPDDCALFKSLQLLPKTTPVTIVNGSGVDTAFFSNHALPVVPSFLMIARLLADKGVREYVNAAQAVKLRYPDVKFKLLGPLDPNPSSISQSELNSWIKSGVIEYCGVASDVRPLIAAASVYVLPSYREGTPRTVLEAMAQGRPIITTDAPGCKETVMNGKNGILIPIRDSVALAEAMMFLIENPEELAAMGCVSRQIAVEKYDVHKVNAVMLRAMRLV
jgi:glycosyltransferase involved in cell wall biosynthesis